MDLWNFNVKWNKDNVHGVESYSSIIQLPPELKAYAVVLIDRGPEFGGHSILVYDQDEMDNNSRAEIHSQEDLPLNNQATAVIAALVQWVEEAMYKFELDKLDPKGEFYVRGENNLCYCGATSPGSVCYKHAGI